jgi:hypothetical protein
VVRQFLLDPAELPLTMSASWSATSASITLWIDSMQPAKLMGGVGNPEMKSKAGYLNFRDILARKKEVVISFKHMVREVSHNRLGMYGGEILQHDI